MISCTSMDLLFQFRMHKLAVFGTVFAIIFRTLAETVTDSTLKPTTVQMKTDACEGLLEYVKRIKSQVENNKVDFIGVISGRLCLTKSDERQTESKIRLWMSNSSRFPANGTVCYPSYYGRNWTMVCSSESQNTTGCNKDNEIKCEIDIDSKNESNFPPTCPTTDASNEGKAEKRGNESRQTTLSNERGNATQSTAKRPNCPELRCKNSGGISIHIPVALSLLLISVFIHVIMCRCRRALSNASASVGVQVDTFLTDEEEPTPSLLEDPDDRPKKNLTYIVVPMRSDDRSGQQNVSTTVQETKKNCDSDYLVSKHLQGFSIADYASAKESSV